MHRAPPRSRFILIAPLLALAGCATTVVPPEPPAAPASVFVLDYGRHTSIAFFHPSQRDLTEYAYGDWNWFALDHSKWHDVFPTLLWPTPGALGRRTLPVHGDAETIQNAIPCEQAFEIIVPAADVIRLTDQLESQFKAGIESQHFQPRYDLTFVPDDRAFHILHNCNHVTAGWLRQLGCKLRGPVMFANFKFTEPAEPTAESDRSAPKR